MLLHYRYMHIKNTKRTHSGSLVYDLITDVVCVALSPVNIFILFPEAEQHGEQPVGGVDRRQENPELGGGRPTITAVLPGEDIEQSGGHGFCYQGLLHQESQGHHLWHTAGGHGPLAKLRERMAAQR